MPTPATMTAPTHRIHPSLSLQCEQVRAYLEEQVSLQILKHAYRTLCTDQNGSVTAESTLCLLHIGQTHLITLLQQLVAAERMQEQNAHVKHHSDNLPMVTAQISSSAH
jgi:hypothetical protein